MILLGIGILACDQGKDERAAGPAAGARTISIAVGHAGYSPGAATARAGEALVLVFTRTEDTECGRYIKVEGVAGQQELPVGTPVAIPVTMPADGELVFTCGMDMMRGMVSLAR